jgi:large subunit ribosomal protein L6
MQTKIQKIPNKTEIFISSLGIKTLLIIKKDSIVTNFKYYTLSNSIILTKKDDHILFSTAESTKQAFSVLEKSFLVISKYLKSFEKPYKKKLILKGLGFKATLSSDSKLLELKLGLSHVIAVNIPIEDLTIKVDKNTIIVEGLDPVKVGNFATQIRNFKYPDSYKGKGFWYKNEIKVLKEVKKT